LYDLELDDEGWTDVAVLIARLRELPAWSDVNESDIIEMMQTADKKRVELVEGRIRSLYGHSAARVRYHSAVPPNELYHGTSPSVLDDIRRDGLLPMGRRYVHLSTDRETARAVGRRKASTPVMILVDAAAAWRAGVPFYVAYEKVWLADRIPPEFLRVAE
jgi:putative RNA 2'-phosphotransferase